MNIPKTNGTEIISDKPTLREAIAENKCSLFEADLTKAELHFADLSVSNLYKANLENTNLMGANLERANLQNANLTNTNLRHVDARWIRISEDVEILFRMDCCIWPVTIFHKKVMIGCKDFTFEEILNMTEEKAESIHEGAGKRWKRWGRGLKNNVLDIIESGIS